MYSKLVFASDFTTLVATSTSALADTCWTGYFASPRLVTATSCTSTAPDTAWIKVTAAGAFPLPADPMWVSVPMRMVAADKTIQGSSAPRLYGYESDGRPKFTGCLCTDIPRRKVFKNSPLQEQSFCADENGVCTFSGVRFVTYGADGHFVTKVANGSIACDNATFGDPAYGTWKHCWVGNIPLAHCADEGGSCSYNFEYWASRLAYGAGDKFFVNENYQDFADCSNSTWGDPNFGVYKSCYVW